MKKDGTARIWMAFRKDAAVFGSSQKHRSVGGDFGYQIPADKIAIRRLFYKPSKFVPSIILCIVMLIGATSCGQKSKSAPALQEVETVKVIKGTIEKNVLFTGSIDAEDAIDIFPRATGKVSKKLLKEGDAVKKDQAILLVDRDEVGYTFRSMPVVSPINGLVGTIFADVGTSVDPAHPVSVVVRPRNMRVKLDIPERYLQVIKPGTEVFMGVDTLDEETFAGKIITASPVVDAKTRTAKIEVLLPNTDGKLKHGMFGRIKLVVLKHGDSLIVPNDAISWEGEKQFVYKILDNKASRTQVKVGLRNDTHVEILEGVAEGDMLAVGDLLDLEDGEAVSIKSHENS